MNNHISQAKNPLKCILGFGKSTTALFLPIMAIDPLSLYLKGIKGLLLPINLKFSAKLNLEKFCAQKIIIYQASLDFFEI